MPYVNIYQGRSVTKTWGRDQGKYQGSPLVAKCKAACGKLLRVPQRLFNMKSLINWQFFARALEKTDNVLAFSQFVPWDSLTDTLQRTKFSQSIELGGTCSPAPPQGTPLFIHGKNSKPTIDTHGICGFHFCHRFWDEHCTFWNMILTISINKIYCRLTQNSKDKKEYRGICVSVLLLFIIAQREQNASKMVNPRISRYILLSLIFHDLQGCNV